MTDAIGRNVRLFLVDGKSTGLITAEIMNWTDRVLNGPRTEFPKFLARSEIARTGVYLLHGRHPDDPDRTLLYIGESDQVGTCVITSKDQNITRTHARYLESRPRPSAPHSTTAPHRPNGSGHRPCGCAYEADQDRSADCQGCRGAFGYMRELVLPPTWLGESKRIEACNVSPTVWRMTTKRSN